MSMWKSTFNTSTGASCVTRLVGAGVPRARAQTGVADTGGCESMKLGLQVMQTRHIYGELLTRITGFQFACSRVHFLAAFVVTA